MERGPLIQTFRDACITHQMVYIINSFPKDRLFCIRICDSKSTPRYIWAVIPQTLSLSPPALCLHCWHSNSTKSLNSLIHLHTIFTQSKYYSHKLIFLLVEWFRQWKITINPLKISVIMSSNKQTQTGDCLKFGDTIIKWEHKIKYRPGNHYRKKNLNFSPMSRVCLQSSSCEIFTSSIQQLDSLFYRTKYC